MTRTVPPRGRELLYVITSLVVVAFQGYWLWSAFHDRRQQLQEQATLALEQELITSLLRQAPGQGAEVMIAGPEDVDIDSLLRMLGDEPIGSAQIAIAQKGADHDGARTQGGTDRFPLLQQASADSSIWAGLQERLDWLPRGSFVLHCTVDGSTTSYPVDASHDAQASGFEIRPALVPGATYQLAVAGLAGIILRDMTWPILASLIYLSLFGLTLWMLLRTAALNRRLLESHERFTRSMTHELKLPISTLSVATEALEKQGAAAPRLTGAMRRAVDQLSGIVDTVLATAMLQQKRVRIEQRAVPLKALLDDVLDRMQVRVEEMGATILVQPFPDDTTVHVAPDYMARVLMNLLDNALKYGGRPPQVRIAWKREGGTDSITVADNGPGMAPEHAKAIFDPFFRAPGTDLSGVKGYGLGLSFVREVVELHGGTVQVERTGPEGTVMAIELPAHGR